MSIDKIKLQPDQQLAILALFQNHTMLLQKKSTVIAGILLSFPVFAILGCKKDIQTPDYIDSSEPILINLLKIGDSSRLDKSEQYVLLPESDKHLKILQWANRNTTDWEKPFPICFIGEITVSQGNFHLTQLKGSVLMKFKDETGNPREYIKFCKNDDLYFLLK